jgi:V8-like Glu-specific endopeptidase
MTTSPWRSVAWRSANGDSARQRGTAFRIGPDVLLTTGTFSSGQTPSPLPVKVVAEFGYETDADGNDMSATQYRCRTNEIHTNREDDWGVIRRDGA